MTSQRTHNWSKTGAWFKPKCARLPARMCHGKFSLQSTLVDARNHDRPLALVLVAEFLAVAAFLLRGPRGHLTTTDNDEEQDAPAESADQVDADPGEDLEQVVGASHKAKPESGGDTPVCGTGAAQVTEHQVGVEIGELGEYEERHAGVEENRVRLGG